MQFCNKASQNLNLSKLTRNTEPGIANVCL